MLTLDNIEKMSIITHCFMRRKMDECEALKAEIKALKAEISECDIFRLRRTAK